MSTPTPYSYWKRPAWEKWAFLVIFGCMTVLAAGLKIAGVEPAPRVPGPWDAFERGAVVTLPETARFYGCKSWESVEAIEVEIVNSGSAAAVGLLTRLTLGNECTRIGTREQVRIIENRATSYRFQRMSGGSIYWATKTF